MPELKCVVVTPEETAVDQNADFVALPLYDGEIGIAPRHSPLIGRLGHGELRLRSGSTLSRYYIDGGFVQVADDVVSVLTGRAIPASEIDRQSAQSQLRDAMQLPASTPEQLESRDRAVSQARGQLLVARHNASR